MARRRSSTVHGVLVVDKPPGVTSHDVVGMIRRRLGERRVGHGGTLDPDATGVLVIAVGQATRLLRFVEATAKRYEGEVVLGTATTTLDSSGDITGRFDMSAVTVDDARQVVAEHLTGPIEQIPPMVSAIKIEGRRLHELAREGVEVDRQARSVRIDRFDIETAREPGVLRIGVECSPGTYIRTLADDLGRLLGGGAHLRALRRTAVGEFTVDEAAPPDDAPLLPVRTAVATLDQVVVDDDVAALVGNGRVLDAWPGEGPWAVSDRAGHLLAVYQSHGDGRAKPAVVMASPVA